MASPDGIDWPLVEATLITHVERAVRAAREQLGGQRLVCAGICGFYADGTQIAWPDVAVASAEWIEENYDECGLNPDDLPVYETPGPDGDRLSVSMSEVAVADDGARFDEVVAALQNVAIAACGPAVDHVRSLGLVGEEFFVAVMDEGEELVARSVSESVLRE